MAGVKGKSGGARPNSGGRRPGAGRPKGSGKKSANPPAREKKSTAGAPPETGHKEPLAFLESVVNDTTAPLKDRIRAAIAAAQYKHTKLHDGGKKDAAAGAAKKAATGRFAPKAPPKLVVNNQ